VIYITQIMLSKVFRNLQQIKPASDFKLNDGIFTDILNNKDFYINGTL
jgi:hypothetical protein